MKGPPVELFRALAVLAEPPTPAHAGVAAALGLPEPPDAGGHADLFLFHLHPYASVHLGPEGMLGGEARARVAGFWRAVGRTPPAEADHLAALLGLHAALREEAAEAPAAEAELIRRSAAALLHEHLLPWLPPFLDRVRELGDPHQRGWAELLWEALLAEATTLPTPGAPARHLAALPPLPDPRRGDGPAFVPALLAPGRTGIILTRHDLAALAREAGLGLRAGERRYALEHLLGMEPAPVLAALARFARAQEAAHRRWPDLLDGVRRHWTGRAAATAALLEELAGDARAAAEAPEPSRAAGPSTARPAGGSA